MGYPYYGSYGGYGGYAPGFRHGRRGGFIGRNGPGFGFGRPVMPSHPIASRPPSMGGMLSGGSHVGSFGRRNP
jgi:hypothetical protein